MPEKDDVFLAKRKDAHGPLGRKSGCCVIDISEFSGTEFFFSRSKNMENQDEEWRCMNHSSVTQSSVLTQGPINSILRIIKH